jgi:hypothetical protein
MRVSRPSPAMAVALLALFIAFGGTSYATVHALVPANSVGTTQLKNDSVTRAKLAHQSITSALIKPGSLLASDFAPGQLPSGPQGPAGPAGASGPKGDKGDPGATGAIARIKVRSAAVTVAAGGVGLVNASCHSDERASGAGTSWTLASGEGGAGLTTISLSPSFDSAGVTAYVGRGENRTSTAHLFTVDVLCYPN